MPATTPNPNKVDPKQNGNAAPLYVKCDLTKEQKELARAWAEDVEYVDVVKWIDFQTDNGEILSVKHIVGQDGYQASLTGGELSTSKKGKCLISRASTGWRAILGLMYKDVMVLEGVWAITERSLDLDL